MKALITVGCMTDHGGIIVLGDSSFLVEGKAVHLDGMTHYCPKCRVQSRAIAKNQGFMVVGNKSIVADGDTSSCGSKYMKISSLAVMTSGSGKGSSTPSSIIPLQNSLVESDQKEIHKIQFKIVDEDTNEGISEMLYEIYSKDTGNLLIKGYTDKQGMTALYESEYSPESIQLITMDLSKPLEEL